jgi:toxin FitB
MIHLLDTNVVGQLISPSPSANVLRWLSSIAEADLVISAITVRELVYGVEKSRLRNPVSAGRFSAAIDAVIASFAGRVLPVDEPVARVWATMLAQSNKHIDDTGLAATAAVHGVVVVTRNLAHLRGRGVPLLDPFRSPPTVVPPAI